MCSCELKLKSHPEKTLFEHLNNVQQLMLNRLKTIELNLSFQKKELEKFAKIIAVTHDFGKATSYFQQYINGKIKNNDETKHAYISALFAFYLADKLNLKNKIIPFLNVKYHHGNLPDIKSFSSLEIKYLEEKQIKSIDFGELEKIYNNFFDEEKTNIDFKEFKHLIVRKSSLLEDIDDITDEIAENVDLETFFLALFLFSLLIDADKLDAGINNQEKIAEIIKNINGFNKPDLVDKYKQNAQLKDSSINKLREDIYQEAVSREFDLNKKIYSINVPTGTGKTFTSLNFALKIKDKLTKNRGFNPKIIYCLPFTSIIDQNYSVIEEILNANEIKNITNELLLKHHYLAETDYKTDNSDENTVCFDTGQSQLLIESWMSSIIVTTFVQFFHSIISNRNKSLRKFHNIANSIVILDEIQAIPHKYWILINEILKKFSEMFNTYFILVTATQPLIFKDDEIIPVINGQKYFEDEKLNRIKLVNQLEKRSLEDFKNLLLDDIAENYPDKSFLIILNTIKSSQKVFQFLNEELNTEEIELKYLSTTVLPYERSKIISEIQNRIESGKRFIVVSTQVVEAGVDIDLDIVYRDLAPLDCIFQSAGRCNRNGGKNKGIVKVFNLFNEKEQAFTGFIYDGILLETTKKLLKQKSEFEEKEFYDLANKYYAELDPHLEKNYRKISNDVGNKILKDMRKLNFEGMKEFKLIPDDAGSFDFFIEIDNNASKIKETVIDIINKQYDKPWERKQALLKHKKEFTKYIISIRLKKGQELNFAPEKYQVFAENPILIPKDEVNNFYDTAGIGFNFINNEKLDSEGLIF